MTSVAAARGRRGGGIRCGGPVRTRCHAGSHAGVRKCALRCEKGPVRTSGKRARMSGGKGLRGLCEARGGMCGERPLTDDVKNLDRPRPGVERVVRKCSGPGGSRRQRILRGGHLPLAPPSKTQITSQPDDLPTNRDAHPWFEGAGSRRRAGRAHAGQAVLGCFGVPRWN